MVLKIDLYEITLTFPRLFPDPAVFEDPIHLANRYMQGHGLSKEKSDMIYQSTDEITPTDERGNPSIAVGTAKYIFEGKPILAEYMSNANIRLAYADFGSGLSASDHSRLWRQGKLGELRFELRDLKHQPVTLNTPEVSELYTILKQRATPNTLSTVELDNVPGQAFAAALTYFRGKLSTLASADSLDAEVYAARDLSVPERSALEKRIGRETNRNTIFVILGQKVPIIAETPK